MSRGGVVSVKARTFDFEQRKGREKGVRSRLWPSVRSVLKGDVCMSLFVAHAVFYSRIKEGTQESYPVWENIYMIRANSLEEARTVVNNRAITVAGDSEGSYTVNGKKAEEVFVGIRKLFECYDTFESPIQEITYNDLVFTSVEAIWAFLEGKEVDAVFID